MIYLKDGKSVIAVKNIVDKSNDALHAVSKVETYLMQTYGIGDKQARTDAMKLVRLIRNIEEKK